jgi:hypothetical protein
MTYSRAELRDVIVEFFSRVDPGRLEAGIDIKGMVDWTMTNGADDMNARLMAKYGSCLDFEGLKSENPIRAMNRISVGCFLLVIRYTSSIHCNLADMYRHF